MPGRMAGFCTDLLHDEFLPVWEINSVLTHHTMDFTLSGRMPRFNISIAWVSIKMLLTWDLCLWEVGEKFVVSAESQQGKTYRTFGLLNASDMMYLHISLRGRRTMYWNASSLLSPTYSEQSPSRFWAFCAERSECARNFFCRISCQICNSESELVRTASE